MRLFVRIKKSFFISTIIILLLFSFSSCTTDKVEGSLFNGYSFRGMSSDDLHSKNKNFKEVKLTFSYGKASMDKKNFYYYDTNITEKNYNELYPFLLNTVTTLMGDEAFDGNEAKNSAKDLFNELTKNHCFVLSVKEIKEDKIKVDLDKDEFNFTGYIGLGYDDGDGYVLYLINTKNTEKGYIFG